jgi:hypothetical protein
MGLASRGPSRLRSGISGQRATLVAAPFRPPRASRPCVAYRAVPVVRVQQRTSTNRWEDVRLETSEYLLSVVGATGVLPVFVPFARDRFEGIANGDLGSPFALSFHCGRIDVCSKAALGIIARCARLHEPDSWIDAKRKRALLAMPPICQAPVLCSVRIDQKVQTAAIGELVRLDLRLGISAFHIR